MPAKQSGPDAYLGKLSADKRATLEKVRKAIRAAAPDAEEGMSYGMPAFIQGKPIAGYAASANHCAYYPMSGAITEALSADLKHYETSKGAIRFPIGKPLPATLIRKLVKARLAEIGDAKPAKKRAGERAVKRTRATLLGEVERTLSAIENASSQRVKDEMRTRYGIITKKAYGVPMAELLAIAKRVGRDHELAAALWETGWYEARMVACMIDDPALVSPAQMDRWARDFDNWGIVDTVCFKLFDQTPHVFAKVDKWSKSKDEFVKRASFALLACASLHRVGTDADYLRRLPLIERAASDERNFVKKGVSWALRAIGLKQSPKLRAAARKLATKLAASDDPTERWLGKDALKSFAKKSATAAS